MPWINNHEKTQDLLNSDEWLNRLVIAKLIAQDIPEPIWLCETKHILMTLQSKATQRAFPQRTYFPSNASVQLLIQHELVQYKADVGEIVGPSFLLECEYLPPSHTFQC